MLTFLNAQEGATGGAIRSAYRTRRVLVGQDDIKFDGEGLDDLKDGEAQDRHDRALIEGEYASCLFMAVGVPPARRLSRSSKTGAFERGKIVAVKCCTKARHE